MFRKIKSEKYNKQMEEGDELIHDDEEENKKNIEKKINRNKWTIEAADLAINRCNNTSNICDAMPLTSCLLAAGGQGAMDATSTAALLGTLSTQQVIQNATLAGLGGLAIGTAICCTSNFLLSTCSLFAKRYRNNLQDSTDDLEAGLAGPSSSLRMSRED